MIEERNRVLRLVLDRPEALNAIDETVLDELEVACASVEQRDDLRALVVTGNGDAFSVGMDLACLDRGFADQAYFRAFLERLNGLLLRLERLPVPTIAAVNGLTRAGGLELLLACDVAICADEARIADNHTKFGVIPGAGATQRLPRRVGVQRAKELIFTSRWLDGKEAERVGLVLRSVPRERLELAAEELVATVTDKSRDCLAAAKRAIDGGTEYVLAEGIQIELREFFAYLESSPDATEGFAAFREGRPPSWRS